jgi:hypothetical protein
VIAFQRSQHGSTVTSTLRASSQLGSPSTTANKLLSNGYDVTLPPYKSQEAPTPPRSSTLHRSHGWRASATTQSTPGRGSRKSSSTTFRGRSPAQVLVMTLLSVNRNAMSSYDHTHTISSTYEPPLRTSRKRTSSTASTMASPTKASIETLGGRDQKLLQDFVT